MAKTLDRDELRRLALVGARTKLQELRAEIASLTAAFPELVGRGAARAVTAAETVTRKARRRRRSTMSAEQRKAVSTRMKKYWAERRKAKR